ncbi:HAD family hydrolase [Mesomycoplasma ovipneumoniae]|uniref:HAD family hydrolase n=1 Tax=Mesomycoplasma ovipneumoniae TaxID=29562 RepID=UPI0030801697
MVKKLIFSDIDGTLYCGDFSVDKETIDFLKNNKDNFTLILNTGNPLGSRILQTAKLLEIRYVLTSNGALFSDLKEDKHTLIHGPISQKSQEFVFKIARDLDMQLNFWTSQKYFSFNFKEQNYSYFNYPLLDPENEVFFTDSPQKDVIKLELIGPSQALEKAYKLLEEDGDLEGVLINNISIEIGKKGTNKGSAVEFVAKSFGIDVQKTMTIGDSPNDISMLEKTNFSYAMANGYEIVKKTAKLNTSACDQQGLVYAIKDFLYRTKFD